MQELWQGIDTILNLLCAVHQHLQIKRQMLVVVLHQLRFKFSHSWPPQ